MADDPATGTALDPALLDALRQVRELTEDLPATLRQGIRSAVSRVEDRSHAVGAAEQGRSTPGADDQLRMWQALDALDGETQKLMAMLRRDGRLWEHAADPLPRLAAEVYAAVINQKEPM